MGWPPVEIGRVDRVEIDATGAANVELGAATTGYVWVLLDYHIQTGNTVVFDSWDGSTATDLTGAMNGTASGWLEDDNPTGIVRSLTGEALRATCAAAADGYCHVKRVKDYNVLGVGAGAVT